MVSFFFFHGSEVNERSAGKKGGCIYRFTVEKDIK